MRCCGQRGMIRYGDDEREFQGKGGKGREMLEAENWKLLEPVWNTQNKV